MTKIAKQFVLPALATLLVGGCQIGNDMKENWQQLGQIVEFVGVNRSTSSVTRTTVDANPYASTGFRYGNSPQAIISLAESQNGRLFWVSSDGLAIVTDQGRIVRTTGFPGNLTGSYSTTKDPLSLPRSTDKDTYQTIRVLDFEGDLGHGHRMECALKSRGTEEITVLGRTFTTRKYAELCKVPTLKWSFENTHWRDVDTGYVWRTRQWIDPSHKKPVELEVLRPAAEDPAWQIHSALKAMY